MTADTSSRTIKTTIEGSSLHFDIRDYGRLSINIDDTDESVRFQAMLHGFKQKIQDAAALPRDTMTGKPASAKDKGDAMKEVIRRMVEEGEWNATARGEGSGVPSGLLVQALCIAKPDVPVENIRAFVAGLDKSTQAALRDSPQIAPIIADIKTRQAKDKGVDVTTLLDGLL